MTYRIHVTLNNEGGPLDCETIEHADEDAAAKLAGWVVERMVRFGIYPGWSISVRHADEN